MEKLKESQDSNKNEVDSRLSQLCIDLELQKRENDSLLKEFFQNMENYKKVTNERIEKLLKLFLSINK